MNLALSDRSALEQNVPLAVTFTHENERPRLPAPWGTLVGGLRPTEFSGKTGQSVLLYHSNAKLPHRLLLVGLGKQNAVTAETLREATGRVVLQLRQTQHSRAAIIVPQTTLPFADTAAAIADAAILANYRFRDFKPSNDDDCPVQQLILCLPASELPAARRAVERARIIAESANYTRHLADQPGNVIYPATLANHARQLARQYRLRCTVFGRTQLERRGFGGLLAVGGGSHHEPRLIVLEYRGAPASKSPIALVGKAITFDSGGISIKPSDKMDEMKFDKSGGCAVLGCMRALAQLKLPLNVLGIVAAAENLPSATSYRPGDIVTSYRGKDDRPLTIEVLNTDAEGRIVLGDAIVYARERGAAAIIDFATLTGACVIALGEFAAGLFGNDERLQEAIRAAADRTGERVWPFPLWQPYKDKIKSHIADIKNTGGRYGGAITAAAFLAAYAKGTPWAHLDIAGTAWATENRPYLVKGATGFGVRLTMELLRTWT
ncbi:MAG: leucyl aminopeptidase [Verrucomicrobiae bacterium]|nr:leucyl aminopeptidase [Verrucomicrobiae bacterium]